MLSKNIQTFIACDKSYDEAKIVLFGAPFDSTTSYRPGARFGPAKIRSESYSIETYSPCLDKDLTDSKVFDAGDLELAFGNPGKALDTIQAITRQILADKKLPIMLGGEHLVTLGAVRALAEFYDDFYVIQFDAHTDLRDEYLGESLSHACVIRRVFEITGKGKIFQFGIRSGERHEFEFAKANTFLNKFDFMGIENIKNIIKDKPVYLTVDLDVLDPSQFPGTGTPEAGGVSYPELSDAIKICAGLNIVACDLNELSPPYDPSGISTALACKLLRELILNLQ